MFINYNDYELLYLYREGSERAYHLVFEKYSYLIKGYANDLFPYGDKKDDLIQEGLIVLAKCIELFNPNLNVTFYTYFRIALQRKYLSLLKQDYYKKNYYLMENYNGYNSKETKMSWLFNPSYLFDDEMECLIYQECIIDDLSINSFADKYHLQYHYVYGIKKAILKKLKSVLTNL